MNSSLSAWCLILEISTNMLRKKSKNKNIFIEDLIVLIKFDLIKTAVIHGGAQAVRSVIVRVREHTS